jgi:APA family basic amino acid/polyamine antiporter
MGRDGLLPPWASKVSPKRRVPHVTTIITGVFVAVWSLVGDANETYNLTNIGTLFAFALVSAGVFVLRFTEPARPRPFRVPWFPVITVASVALCVYVMFGLPGETWIRFAVWLGIGLALYFGYGYRHSRIRRPLPSAAPQ